MRPRPNRLLRLFREPQSKRRVLRLRRFLQNRRYRLLRLQDPKWYVVDRKKELIKVRGFQVAPPEIESVLLGHPQIADAAVIGIKKADAEQPRAYVVKRPVPESEALDEAAVKKHCGERLAKFKELTGGIRFVDAIPKNASGKILKRLLREAAEAEQEQEKARL